MKFEKIRKQVLEAILEAVDLGLISGTSGNIAVQDEVEDVAAITPSGIVYKTMKAEDIAIVDMDGNWIDGPFKPSSETPMHTAVLTARKDVKATVHTHGMFATIMAMTDEPLLPITPPQCEFVPVNIIPFVMPGSADLARKVVDILADGRAVLLKNHGMFCCGRTIRDAMAATIFTEEMAKGTYYAKLLGSYEPLPNEAIKRMQALIAADKAV